MDSNGGTSRHGSRSRSGSPGHTSGRSASKEWRRDSKSRRKSRSPDSGRRKRSRSRSQDRHAKRHSKWDSKVPDGTSSSASSSKFSTTCLAASVAQAPAAPGATSAAMGFVMPTVSDTPTVYSGPLILGPPPDKVAAAAAQITSTLNSRIQPPPPSTAPPPTSVPVGPVASAAHTVAAAAAKSVAASAVVGSPGVGGGGGTAFPVVFGPRKTNDADADRKQRRLYVGNLPPGSTQPDVVGFFNGALLAVNAQTGFVKEEDDKAKGEQLLPVERCEVFNESSRFCFLELRNEGYTVLCIKLDGINYNGYSLRVGRPHDYVPPPDGDPALHTHIPLLDDARKSRKEEKRETASRSDTGPDNKIYIQNLPPEMGEEQVRDLLEQFGTLRVLNLIKNVQTGQHKGYGFFEYEDPEVTDQAILALNGFVCGANILSVQRANFSGSLARDTHRTMTVTNLPNSVTQTLLSDPLVAVQVRAARKIGERPSKVVQLLNCVYQEDLIDPKEYEALYEDIKQEAAKHGALEEVLVPKPNEDLSYREGVGKVFLRYADVTAARKAQLMLNGRRFDSNRIVCAAFFPEDRFAAGRYTLT
ncbi:u2 snrnp auxiliary factor or splicing [Cystoisospora suis]|uniref:Splicing factor U2AF subunit n=1 Tax=Cystoisospora suis TaxID=483139 RepID=A0A2C6KT73_9APIC|nr:u2 snrnp auxiliary factor or splicing [Cystoisospora suis]